MLARALGVVAGLGAVGAIASTKVAFASDDALHSPSLPWFHNALYAGYDHASIRRGFQVYKNVCANCHSINAIAYRHLINTCLTADEVVALAEDAEVEDGPDQEGEMYGRPGKITDFLPRPYANPQAARFANGGALPPDLSQIIKARPGGGNYLFALLTGYRDPPAGVEIREGLYYNPYCPGGAIAMAQALTSGVVEYEDGTEATISQMAKDVTNFLSWVSEPELDDRKKFGMKAMLLMGLLVFPALYMKRLKWSVLKSRKIRYYDYKK